ncbi:MAG: hypothetical protein WC123_07480 [Bacilli bacterium]
MRKELREHIIEENKYYDLLISNPRYKPCGCSKDFKKRIVGIIKGDPSEYIQGIDRLDFKYFDSWKDAYTQLAQ